MTRRRFVQRATPRREKRQHAVALQYDAERHIAPEVTAVGRGEIAERIIALARESGVPIREDPDLVGLLAQLDVGDVIPSELYPVIAEVLAFVYRLKETAGRKKAVGRQRV